VGPPGPFFFSRSCRPRAAPENRGLCLHGFTPETHAVLVPRPTDTLSVPPLTGALSQKTKINRGKSTIPSYQCGAAAREIRRGDGGERRARGGVAQPERARADPERRGRRARRGGSAEGGGAGVPDMRGRRRAGARRGGALRRLQRVRLPRLPGLLRVRAARGLAGLPPLQDPLQAPQGYPQLPRSTSSGAAPFFSVDRLAPPLTL
jgi:hypothetical protein